jgi:mono/diheme cytochrome c family protein
MENGKKMKNEHGCAKKRKSLLVMTTFLCLIAFLTEAYGESGTPEQGYNTYTKYCVGCHGTNGKGDGPLAQILNPPPADLASAKVQSKTDEVLLSTIRKGRPGTAMPSWEKDLSQQEIHNVLAHLRTFKP